MTNLEKNIIFVREVTSRLPRIKGLGMILALIAKFFKKRASTDIAVSVFGRKMLLNPGDAIGNVLIFTPQWFDPKERKLIQKILGEGDYVVDVGANIGAYTLLFSDMVGRFGRVTAIEAEAKNAGRLAHNISINGIDWVDIQNFGVSDKDESLSLVLNDDGNAGAHTFYKQSMPEGVMVQWVECKPLFGLLEKIKPKLMKLDIEGFEWRVLRKYFEDAPESLWPEYIFLEDEPRHREGDAVSLVSCFGYRTLERFDTNVFMVR
jgi:FkbM family methyltransferase